MSVIKRNFFERETLVVARELLGCFLVVEKDGQTVRARIMETEAYVGEDDLACHASKGRTKRTETLYGEAGYAYVYLVYGLHELLNIVTGAKDFPAAVLIRAVEVGGVLRQKTNGPGKLTRLFGIDRTRNGHDMTQGEGLWVEKGKKFPGERVMASERIGVAYAKHCAKYPWRFRLIGDHRTSQ